MSFDLYIIPAEATIPIDPNGVVIRYFQSIPDQVENQAIKGFLKYGRERFMAVALGLTPGDTKFVLATPSGDEFFPSVIEVAKGTGWHGLGLEWANNVLLGWHGLEDWLLVNRMKDWDNGKQLTIVGQKGLPTLDPTADLEPYIDVPPPKPSDPNFFASTLGFTPSPALTQLNLTPGDVELLHRQGLKTEEMFYNTTTRNAYWGYKVASSTRYEIVYGRMGAKCTPKPYAFNNIHELINDLKEVVYKKTRKGNYHPALYP